MAAKVSDIMIPIEEYPAVKEDQPLKDAVAALRKIYCQVESGTCTEAGHRAVLVQNDKGWLVGILDFATILRVLVPEIAGGLSEQLKKLDIAFTNAEAGWLGGEEEGFDFEERVKINANTKTRDVMLRVRGTARPDDSLLEALRQIYQNKLTILPVYRGDQPLGVVRDSDIFLTTVSMFAD
jgi:CBS domain-containing protein